MTLFRCINVWPAFQQFLLTEESVALVEVYLEAVNRKHSISMQLNLSDFIYDSIVTDVASSRISVLVIGDLLAMVKNCICAASTKASW
jgi:hypothetical protein